MKLEMSTKTKGTDFERVKIEEGIYPALLKEVKDISEGQYGERVAFIYEINGKEFSLVCYKTKATVNNKLGRTLIAHGAVIKDEEVETDKLPMRKVNAWVEDYETEIEKDGKPVKVTYSTISKVKPLTEKA